MHKMKKMKRKIIIIVIIIRNNTSDTIILCSMKLNLYRNFHHISLNRFCVVFIYENKLFRLVVMAT